MSEVTKQTTSLIKPEHAKNVQSVKTPANFIPEIKITYKTSQHFGDGKAKLGDFFFEDTSLGQEISVVPIAYNYQAIARKRGEPGKGDFIDKLVLPESDLAFRDNPAYHEFSTKYNEADIEEGLLILLYLPDTNIFGVLFAKKFLAEGGFNILKSGGDYRVLKVKTEKQANKKQDRVWFTLSVSDTGRNLQNIENEEERVKIFTKSIDMVASKEEAEAVNRPR